MALYWIIFMAGFSFGMIAMFFIFRTEFVNGYLEQKARNAWALKQLKEAGREGIAS